MPEPRSPRLLPEKPIMTLADYVATGGGRGLEQARNASPEDVVATIARSGLRGRGGAGFPTARKWTSILRSEGRRYAVCNAAEGEPGTFKDRALMRSNPYAVVEGLAVAAITIGASEAYIAMKESFAPELVRVNQAAKDMMSAGWLDGIDITIATGPEEYLFGEEKALLEVIEGKDPLPRWLPPYLHGLYATAPQLGWESTAADVTSDSGRTYGDSAANPTLVNNTETLARVAWILAHGADAFVSVGTKASPGSVICTVVGDVDRPGVVEVEMGTRLREIVTMCGGPRSGRTVKAVLPGVANAVLTDGSLDTPLSYEGFEAVGSGLGAAGFVVYDDTACMVEVTAMVSRFLAVESCGQCLPCKLGTGQITGALDRIRTEGGSDVDLDIISERLQVVTDGNRCYLPVQEQSVVSSLMQTFPEDFATHLDGWCPSQRTDYPIPKVVDITDGVVTYDARQAKKRPDWTYAD